MNKFDFLNTLIDRLNGLPTQDIQSYVDYYSEMIDDRIEDGMSEQQAVEALGSLDDVVLQILNDTPLTTLVKNKVNPRRRLSAFEIILLILGSPIWISILLALFAVILSVFIVLWAVVVSLYAVNLCLAVGALAGVAGAAVLLVFGTLPQVAVMLGAGLILAGLTIFAFFGCNATAKGMAWLSRWIILKIKACFVRKESLK